MDSTLCCSHYKNTKHRRRVSFLCFKKKKSFIWSLEGVEVSQILPFKSMVRHHKRAGLRLLCDRPCSQQPKKYLGIWCVFEMRETHIGHLGDSPLTIVRQKEQLALTIWARLLNVGIKREQGLIPIFPLLTVLVAGAWLTVYCSGTQGCHVLGGWGKGLHPCVSSRLLPI